MRGHQLLVTEATEALTELRKTLPGAAGAQSVQPLVVDTLEGRRFPPFPLSLRHRGRSYGTDGGAHEVIDEGVKECAHDRLNLRLARTVRDLAQCDHADAGILDRGQVVPEDVRLDRQRRWACLDRVVGEHDRRHRLTSCGVRATESISEK